MTHQVKLSILDYSPVDEGLLPVDALAASVRLAQHGERKGFHRFWVSEHHGAPATASNSPEILMSLADAFHLWLTYAESANPFKRVPSLATARDYLWAADELAIRERNKGRLISGTAPQVVNQLRELAKAYGTEEVMINLMMPGESARLNAIEAISKAMDEMQ